MTGTTRARTKRAGKAPAKKGAAAEAASPGTNPVLTALAERFPLWRRPGYLVRRLHQIHSAIFFEECAAFGITPVQYGLTHVAVDQSRFGSGGARPPRRHRPHQCRRRAQAAGAARPDLAQREPHRSPHAARPPDGEGERLVEAMHPAMARAQDRLLETLGKRERETFVMTLMQLLEANNHHGRAPLVRESEDDD